MQPYIYKLGGWFEVEKNTKDSRQRILRTCVKLFIERGFRGTTMLDIIHHADISAGTFQNIFRTKDNVLLSLTNFMFNNQFDMAREIAKTDFDPVLTYSVETAIQFAITELNENLREIYIEAYTQPEISEYIYKKTSSELEKLFKKYNPTWQESDFYENEIGTAGMMRSFMVHHCNKYFTLDKKVERFLGMSLSVYNVPKDEQKVILEKIKTIDLTGIAKQVLNKLFTALEMTFDFKFSNNIKFEGE